MWWEDIWLITEIFRGAPTILQPRLGLETDVLEVKLKLEVCTESPGQVGPSTCPGRSSPWRWWCSRPSSPGPRTGRTGRILGAAGRSWHRSSPAHTSQSQSGRASVWWSTECLQSRPLKITMINRQITDGELTFTNNHHHQRCCCQMETSLIHPESCLILEKFSQVGLETDWPPLIMFGSCPTLLANITTSDTKHNINFTGPSYIIITQGWWEYQNIIMPDYTKIDLDNLMIIIFNFL